MNVYILVKVSFFHNEAQVLDTGLDYWTGSLDLDLA
jgi:hypothetical protein